MSRFDLAAQDHVALITGGASGIGREVAAVFAEAGYRVALADIDSEAGERTAAELREKGADAEFVLCDVGQEDQVAAAVAACSQRWNRLDFLFNNAGISGHGTTIDNLEAAELEHVLAVDLKAVFYTCKHAIPVMRAQGGGTILNVSSITAATGSPYYAPYGAAKAGVIALTRGLARNIGRYNIRINCLNPGSVTGTRLMRDNPLRPQDVAVLIKTIPAGRPGQPRDIAHFALFLASPFAAHIHGAVLTIDGGESLGYL
jgi:NAD(P)-dependent dehydrogenase (short-subunit alcohol dehydrogenase family)